VVHDRVDPECVDVPVEDSVGGREREDLQVGADRLGGDPGGDAAYGVCDVSHVDEHEHADDLGADDDVDVELAD
jgi:hypothetical protein